MADKKCAMSIAEAASLFADPYWAAKYPPVLTKEHISEMLGVPTATVYGWSSQGLLEGCKFKAGKHLRVFRDRFIKTLSEGKLHGGS